MASSTAPEDAPSPTTSVSSKSIRRSHNKAKPIAYLDDLVAENKSLRTQATATKNDITATPTVWPNSARKVTSSSTNTTQAPAVDGRPWFIELGPQSPILVNEAADAAFATRFRQALLGGKHHGHIPRVNYATDESLLALSDADCPWPSPARARFLVDVALSHVSRYYHIVRRSAILEILQSGIPGSGDSITRSKLWVLFAIGEMYSCLLCPGTRVLRIVSERPSIPEVELRLLLVYFSLALNRRHAAYTLAGSAVRLAVVMGLHLNVPPSQLEDPAVREHRVRVWWTAYHFDRLCASNLGNPYAIDTEEVQVDLPADRPELEGTPAAGDFADAAYIMARVKLTRVLGRIVLSIYGRRIHRESLSHRVQQALKDLSAWVEELPAHLHIDAKGSGASELVPKPISLRLSLNQVIINATRPILLHVLRTHAASWAPAQPPDSDSTATRSHEHSQQQQLQETPEQVVLPVPKIVSKIGETCIRCARHSVRLLTEAWVDGSFKTFNFLYIQYLFSATTILAISMLMPGEGEDDDEQFETAANILAQVRDSGSYSGEEFCRHLEAMRAAMEEGRRRRNLARDGGDAGLQSTPATAAAAAATAAAAAANAADLSSMSVMQSGDQQQQPPLPAHQAWPHVSNETPMLPLLESSLQDLLSQSTPDLNFIDASNYGEGGYAQGMYWPESWAPDGWSVQQ
ncbi:hypothetical protein PpBr36_04085 [Pyricularia pennisetigena]|uniref:hypothetical protein n=1 Tax=Pyricularia pennisetigena TaxID=1578925 RepID=UPI001153A595|nr:hypothetical protein PpBr36_04085 [Pyricularia pennisetigena]TLS27031.1 hypothetical protein PpBr36_04085 [Pyricularia pennisetigena]